MRYKLVIFDLDGTLIDTSEGVLEAVVETIRVMGWPEIDKKTQLSFIGPPLGVSFKRIFGCDEETTKQATKAFREVYAGGTMFHAKPYDGIFELCRQLKDNGCKIALATYKREDYAKELLNYLGFEPYFDTMRGADKENLLTKSDIIKLCLEDLHAESSESILLGDSLFDAKGAAEIGLPFLAVTYGFGFKTEEELKEYPNIGAASSPMDALRFLK